MYYLIELVGHKNFSWETLYRVCRGDSCGIVDMLVLRATLDGATYAWEKADLQSECLVLAMTESPLALMEAIGKLPYNADYYVRAFVRVL